MKTACVVLAASFLFACNTKQGPEAKQLEGTWHLVVNQEMDRGNLVMRTALLGTDAELEALALNAEEALLAQKLKAGKDSPGIQQILPLLEKSATRTLRVTNGKIELEVAGSVTTHTYTVEEEGGEMVKLVATNESGGAHGLLVRFPTPERAVLEWEDGRDSMTFTRAATN